MTSLKEFRRLLLSIALVSALVGSAANAQTYRGYGTGNGAHPYAGVTIKGNLVYGTTAYGGGGGGAVYEIHLGTLYGFGPGDTGPLARVIFGPDGRLYGTYSDSTGSFVFNMLPQATICKTACQPWKLNDIHDFTGFPSDGATAGYGDLTWDQQGNIYGTTTIGGAQELGVVYELLPPVPPSKTWTEKVLWSFTGPDGANPQNAVIFDGNGNLFGTTKRGGAYGYGTVFKLTPSGNTWTETNVYDFQGGNDGRYPIAGLMMDGSGNFYGATSDGGSGLGGTVFELTPSGNAYTFNLLYSFSGQLGQNAGPWATLSMDAAGSLYGTTLYGGANRGGRVFKLTNTQNGWVYSSLHDFGSGLDFINPISNVTFDADGNLWGTATGCNSGCLGGVWEITP